MHGTADVAKLCVWINLITSLKEYVTKNNTKTIRSMMVSMDDGFDFSSLARDIFGKYSGYLNFNSPVDLNYLGALAVMSAPKVANTILATGTKTSAYYSFKGN
jgi:hypothetical protein